MLGGDAASDNNRGRLPFTWITTMRIQSWHNGEIKGVRSLFRARNRCRLSDNSD